MAIGPRFAKEKTTTRKNNEKTRNTCTHVSNDQELNQSCISVMSLKVGHTGERICNGEQTEKNVQNLVIR